MKMKRYFAANARQALRELREDQGPDAVILSNKRVNGGVEIIAAMDYEDAMINASLGNPEDLSVVMSRDGRYGAESQDGGAMDSSVLRAMSTSDMSMPSSANNSLSEQTTSYQGQQTQSVQFMESDIANTADSNQGSLTFMSKDGRYSAMSQEGGALNKIQDELKGLRDIMEAPLMQLAWGETDRVQPLYASLLKQLMTLGLSARLSQHIAKRTADQGLNKHSWKESLKLLAKLVPVSDGNVSNNSSGNNDEDILNNGGIVTLVGPTGVGKTTTIAKLAARFALKHGRRGITLITTDNYRIGAHEQLRTYGRILGIPVHVAADNEELRNLLKQANEKTDGHNLTLIDTAGICQKDTRLADQLAMLSIRELNIKNFLVLSATSQMNLQDDVIRSFSQLKLQGCMLTKIDEASSLGEIISVLVQHELPLHFVCNGQKVPDDLHQARGNLLVKEAVKLMRNTNKSPSTEELAYTFGGMVTNAII
jgi:flagellar biosynthesis protein FlhF